MTSIRTLIITASMAVAIVASPFAAAHASLKSSNPKAGETLAAAPKEIVLTFNEKVEQAFSTITLSDGEGKPVVSEKAKVDTSNPAVLRLNAPSLNSGTYSVIWAVAGHDGHRRKGDFKFTVK